MPLLGMLAAGAAVGARNAANQSVAAQNDLEMRQHASNMEDRREALRQQYLDKKYETQRADAKEAAKNNALIEEAKYQRTRSDKIADEETGHKRKLELEGIKESGRNSRFGQRQALLREKSSSGDDGGGDMKLQSTIGKEASDYVKTGQAKNYNEGFKLAAMKQASSIILGNPMSGMLPPDQLTSKIKDLAGQLYSNEFDGESVGAEKPTVTRLQFNPKTGGF